MKKGDIFAIEVPKKGYIYIQLIAGTSVMGYMLKVFNYISGALEKDIENILIQPSAFEFEYIFGALFEEDKLIKVGNEKLNYKSLIGRSVYRRISLECNRGTLKFYKQLLEEFNGEPTSEEWYEVFINYAKKGVPHKFTDWYLDEYRIVSNRGKLDYVGKTVVGELNDEQTKIYLDMLSVRDFIYKITKGVDKETALTQIFI